MISGSLFYSIVFSRFARKELEKLDHSIALRILKKIENLPENPRPVGCKKLTGLNSLWRIRIGDYRVVYEIDDPHRRIDISIVRHRSKVYNNID